MIAVLNFYVELKRSSFSYLVGTEFFHIRSFEFSFLTFPQNIPYKFTKRYLDEKKDQVTLQVSDGRTWIVKFSVNVVSSGQHKAKFSHTWKNFARDNNLEVGDVCVFELIN